MDTTNFQCFALIFLCLLAKKVDGRKSTTDEKLDALENLVRSEFFLVHGKIQTEKEERQHFMTQLNKTLDLYLDEAGGKIRDAGQMGGTFMDLNKIKTSILQNDKMITDLSESLLRTRRGIADEKTKRKSLHETFIRIKRGLLEEKKARKNDLETLIVSLNEIAEKQNEIIQHQTDMNAKVCQGSQSWNEDSVSQIILTPKHSDGKQNELINEIKQLHKAVEAMAGKFGTLEDKMDTFGEKLSEVDEKIQNLQDIIGYF